MDSKRIRREQIIVEKMISIYCKDNHPASEGLCEECSALLDYAKQRLERCFFGKDKPVCAKCPIHCYQQIMKNKIIQIMRYSGPRMLYKHPVLAILHFIDSYKSRKILRYRCGK